jgi:hypothetical protein
MQRRSRQQAELNHASATEQQLSMELLSFLHLLSRRWITRLMGAESNPGKPDCFPWGKPQVPASGNPGRPG